MTVESAVSMRASDLELSTGTSWSVIPRFGSSLVIGTSFTSPGCDAVRLKEAIGRLRHDSDDRSPGRTVVLHGSDARLVRLGSREGSLAESLRQAGVRAVIAPGFSTWWDWSPFESLLAMARSAQFASELARAVPTIPTIVWRHHSDLDRWAAWISGTGVTAISVDLGTARNVGHWSWALQGIERLARRVPPAETLRLIVNGPSTLERLVKIRSVWQHDLTFATQNPWQLARSGKRLHDDLSAVADTADSAELEVANRETFERVASGVTGEGQGEPYRLSSAV